MLKALSFGTCLPSGMGAIRSNNNWIQGQKACVPSTCPGACANTRDSEEGPPQHYGDQDDERECDCIVHEPDKAHNVPKYE